MIDAVMAWWGGLSREWVAVICLTVGYLVGHAVTWAKADRRFRQVCERCGLMTARIRE